MTDAVVAISASGGIVSCAARNRDGRIATHALERGEVAVAFAAVCDAAGLRPEQLQGLVVDVGPGSYTGLRVAVTFARMLASFGALRLAEITSFELHALAALRGDSTSGRTEVRVVLDARRERFHTGRLRIAERRIELVEAPRAVDAATLLDAIDGSQCVVADPRVEALLADHCAVVGAPLVALVPLEPAELFAAELAPRPIEPERIEPLYLMGSYAEER